MEPEIINCIHNFILNDEIIDRGSIGEFLFTKKQCILVKTGLNKIFSKFLNVF